MSQLPRPVKQVLSSGPLDARVARTWARLQRTRRGPRVVRSGFVLAGALAAAALAVVLWPRAAIPTPPVALVSAAPMVHASPAPAPGVTADAPHLAPPRPHGDAAPAAAAHAPLRRSPTRVWWKGRPQPGAPRPSLMRVSPGAEEKVDSVDALLASADEAWRAGDTARAAALLSELAAHHPEDARAGQALYLLGQMQLDVLGAPEQAVDSFQRALQLGVPDELTGPLWQALERAQGPEDDSFEPPLGEAPTP
ncbi:MAG: tetratricopeptide repeat protein [Myxococcota bacterium]